MIAAIVTDQPRYTQINETAFTTIYRRQRTNGAPFYHLFPTGGVSRTQQPEV